MSYSNERISNLDTLVLNERVTELEHGEQGIPDAPKDGKPYARKDGDWAELLNVETAEVARGLVPNQEYFPEDVDNLVLGSLLVANGDEGMAGIVIKDHTSETTLLGGPDIWGYDYDFEDGMEWTGEDIQFGVTELEQGGEPAFVSFNWHYTDGDGNEYDDEITVEGAENRSIHIYDSNETVDETIVLPADVLDTAYTFTNSDGELNVTLGGDFMDGGIPHFAMNYETNGAGEDYLEITDHRTFFNEDKKRVGSLLTDYHYDYIENEIYYYNPDPIAVQLDEDNLPVLEYRVFEAIFDIADYVNLRIKDTDSESVVGNLISRINEDADGNRALVFAWGDKFIKWVDNGDELERTVVSGGSGGGGVRRFEISLSNEIPVLDDAEYFADYEGEVVEFYNATSGITGQRISRQEVNSDEWYIDVDWNGEILRYWGNDQGSKGFDYDVVEYVGGVPKIYSKDSLSGLSGNDVTTFCEDIIKGRKIILEADGKQIFLSAAYNSADSASCIYGMDDEGIIHKWVKGKSGVEYTTCTLTFE